MRTLALPTKARLPAGPLSLIAFLLLFAVLSGAATAFAGQMGVFVFGGLALGAVALVLPLRWLVVALVFMSFVVTGQLTFFAGIEKANWIPYLMGLLLLVRLPIDAIQRSAQTGPGRVPSTGSLFMAKLSIWLYLVTLLASTLINASPPFQAVLGSKDLLFLWGLYLVLAAGLIKPELVERIWLALPWLLLFQFPLILYQRFIVMPSRTTAAAWDSVVGAFGGNPDGGGASGAMGIFCLIAMVTAITRWRNGLMPGWQAFLLTLIGILSIVLAEVKFMIFLLPVAFGLMSMRELVKRPVKALVTILSGLALAVAVLFAYANLYHGDKGKQATVEEYFSYIYESNIDPNLIDYKIRQFGRIASIVFWAQKHSLSDPTRLLVGHGIGSSRIAMTYIGEAQKPYSMKLGRTSIAVLLWETGLIGTFAYFAIHIFAYITLFRWSGDTRRSSESRVVMSSMAVAMVLLAAGIPYNTDSVAVYQIEVLLMLCLGYMAMPAARSVLSQVSSVVRKPLMNRQVK